MDGIIIFWIAAIVVFAVAEAVTAGLVCIWFVLGGVAALITACFHGPLWLQIVWFVVVSVVTLLLTRPLARKYINSRRQPTNADRLLGREGVVTERIDDVAGQGGVKIDGKHWAARSGSGAVIPEGRHVVAQEIRGVRLIVEEVKQDGNSKEE